LIPCLLFGLLVILIKPKYKNGWKIFCLNIFVIVSFFSLNVNFFDKNYVTPAFTAYYKNLIAGTWYFFRDSNFTSPRAQPAFFSNAAPENNIVFIVDESVRADHLGLNGYERDTTPFLVELNEKGLIRNWGEAVSGTTESVNSNRLLLSGLNRLPDPEFNVNKMTSIFQYAKAMGYRTFYFDGQMDSGWNGTRFDVVDYGLITSIKDYKSESKLEIDGEIAERVNEVLKHSNGNFIWINKRGVHIPYETNYPEAAAVWLPTDRKARESELINNNQPLINNYDNAIRYNFETFFRNLFPEGVLNNTIYVYTSDHGQTLIQGKGSHAGRTKNEASVPLFIIAQPELLPEVDTAFKATHSNIFPTLLDMMKYPEIERKYDYSLSLFKAKKENSRPRYYFAGSLVGGASGELLLYDE
jgi:glucan phosphoethanolaminetransferase (alkaline phosphatase superfamily)